MPETIKVAKGETLIHEGEESTSLYYLNVGTMAIYKRKGNSENQIGTVYSGEVIGEMSFLDNKPRSATVKAIGDCEVTVIPSHKFEKFQEGLPPWYTALVHTLTDRLRRANSRIKV